MGKGGAGEEGGYLDGPDPGEAVDSNVAEDPWSHSQDIASPRSLFQAALVGSACLVLCTVSIILSICENNQGLAKVAFK